MLEALLVIGGTLVLGVLPIYLGMRNYRRDWIGIWRGKKIQITHTSKGLRRVSHLTIDGEEILVDRMGNSYQSIWSDPVHGETSIHISYLSDSGGVTSSCQVVMDGEIVHLVEAPRTMWGRSIPEQLPLLKETAQVEGTTITDPRFAAAERLYSAIRTETGDDEDTMALLEELHNELIEHILIAERLLQSKNDYVALGNDGGELEILQQETEDRIQALLGALQDVHLAVVQRSFSSGAETLENVRNVLSKIHAETEVEKKTSQKLKQNMMQKAAKKL